MAHTLQAISYPVKPVLSIKDEHHADVNEMGGLSTDLKGFQNTPNCDWQLHKLEVF
jgi:hypothetical protein